MLLQNSKRFVKYSLETLILWGKRLLYIAVLVTIGFAGYHLFVKDIIDGNNVVVGIVGVWTITAYLLLPRINRILTKLYVPDYFIGRVRSADGMLSDPINLTFLGSEKKLLDGMQKAGWVLADTISLRSVLGIILSVVFKKSYPRAPISPLYLFSRKQDYAFQQEVEGNPHRRHHVRIWKCPDNFILPGGYRADWVAAGTYDRSVGFSAFTLQITHKIAENVDEERDYIIQSLKNVKAISKVRIIENYSTAYHYHGSGGDRIRTDGAMPIITL